MDIPQCAPCPHQVIGGPCRGPGCSDVAGHSGPCPRPYVVNDPQMLEAMEKVFKRVFGKREDEG